MDLWLDKHIGCNILMIKSQLNQGKTIFFSNLVKKVLASLDTYTNLYTFLSISPNFLQYIQNAGKDKQFGSEFLKIA